MHRWTCTPGKLALLSEGRLADALAEAIPSKLTAGKGADAADADGGGGGGASSAEEPSLEQQKGAPPANGALAQACAVPFGRTRLSGHMFARVCRALAAAAPPADCGTMHAWSLSGSLSPQSTHVHPPCPYLTCEWCGGCAAAAQLAAKLAALGEPPPSALAASVGALGRRTTARRGAKAGLGVGRGPGSPPRPGDVTHGGGDQGGGRRVLPRVRHVQGALRELRRVQPHAAQACSKGSLHGMR